MSISWDAFATPVPGLLVAQPDHDPMLITPLRKHPPVAVSCLHDLRRGCSTAFVPSAECLSDDPDVKRRGRTALDQRFLDVAT